MLKFMITYTQYIDVTFRTMCNPEGTARAIGNGLVMFVRIIF